MATFAQLIYRIQEEKEILPNQDITTTTDGDGDGPLLDSGEDTKAMEVIRIGKNLDKNFWENFMKMCNNDGFADLLNLKPPNNLSGWVERVRTTLKRVEEADSRGKKNKMLATGNIEPTAKVNSDEGPVTYPSDTRPT